MRMPPLFSYATLASALLTMAGVSCAKPSTYALPEETPSLRPGPGGVETAKNNCLLCHSADYVNTQPPNCGKTFWETEVTVWWGDIRCVWQRHDLETINKGLSLS